MTDDDFKKQLKKWKVDSPDNNFADMIVQNAVKHPQQKTLLAKFEDFMYRSLTDWQYGLSFKFASLTLCALFGLNIGWNQETTQDFMFEEMDIVDLAFHIPEEEEEESL